MAAGNPGPEWVDVDEVIAENDDDTLDIRIGNPKKAGRILEGVAEGTAVGQFRRVGGVDHRSLRALKRVIGPLLQDADPAIRTAAETVAALFGRGGRKDIVQQLAGVAASTKRTSAQRVQALTLLGVLMAQEIDR